MAGNLEDIMAIGISQARERIRKSVQHQTDIAKLSSCALQVKALFPSEYICSYVSPVSVLYTELTELDKISIDIVVTQDITTESSLQMIELFMQLICDEYPDVVNKVDINTVDILDIEKITGIIINTTIDYDLKDEVIPDNLNQFLSDIIEQYNATIYLHEDFELRKKKLLFLETSSEKDVTDVCRCIFASASKWEINVSIDDSMSADYNIIPIQSSSMQYDLRLWRYEEFRRKLQESEES